jgi:pimeloyl-ACP methyl ester carboxylesterase
MQHTTKVFVIAIMVFLTLSTILSSLLMTPMFMTASAATSYTETNGTLGGANYTIRIPNPIESWNRDVVVLCRGYSHDMPSTPMGTAPFSNENWSQAAITRGAAFAVSTYGHGGYCVQEGMNATYQLTQYVRSTFNATGKIYLVGVSMGGNIALMLGEKYPQVYSGILDVCGAKNLTYQYDGGNLMSTANDTEITAYLQSVTAPEPPYPFSLYGSAWRTFYRSWCSQAVADMATECGGTPNTMPQAYQNIDPIYHANITIPVISVHGTSDALVPYSRTLNYQAAVATAGKTALYRLYPVAGGEHVGNSVLAEAANHLNELAAWSNALTRSLTLTPAIQMAGSSVTVDGTGFGATNAVGIGFGAEINVINEVIQISGPYDVGTGPYIGYASHLPIKPGTFTMYGNISNTVSIQYAIDLGNGTLTSNYPSLFVNGTIDYATGKYTRFVTSPVNSTFNSVHRINYTSYQYNVTPAAGAIIDTSGTFTASIIVPDSTYGNYSITAIDSQGNIAVATLDVNATIPEGFTVGVMVLLSSFALIVSSRYFQKRPKIEEEAK